MSDLEDLGVQRVVINLCKHFDRSLVNLTLILWRRAGRVAAFLPPDAAVIETDPGLPWPRFLFRLPRYLEELKRINPDVVLSCVPGTNLGMALIRSLLPPHVGFVACEHAFLSRAFALGEYQGVFRCIYQALMRPMYNEWADRLIMTARAGKQDAVEHWGLDGRRIQVIYNPQDIADLKSRAAEPLDDDWFCQREVPVVIAAGRLVPQKGFDTLLDAFARLRARYNARLVILGRGPLEQPLREQADRLQIADSVRFLGFQPNHLRFIARSALFVMSSRWEAMPMVLAETMVVGTPIVSFNCPSGPYEMLNEGRCGFLVPDQDTTALADAMEHALTHPEAARERAALAWEQVQHFEARRVTRQYETLLEEVVAEKRL